MAAAVCYARELPDERTRRFTKNQELSRIAAGAEEASDARQLLVGVVAAGGVGRIPAVRRRTLDGTADALISSISIPVHILSSRAGDRSPAALVQLPVVMDCSLKCDSSSSRSC